ncbi:hypothetical protein I6A60_34150 [Frankia sp. AgB1.9]|uniref:hypothetical protein n=1 Tax=unclassified Frankia TaxID=2632575 RepID=UPI0019319DA1|nr:MULTISPECIES: hypothetical protein [unclassified Frankia]MBL7488148.1 hypothetical protein [Frankia sp. AgW1.1]MBL7552860.1 hypothetical protein [Frankia sp. AgB1.9]MBL7620151.1 hypothetical protein [Frankia sp. AgB1.8]
MIIASSVCFWLEKLGSAEREWEDAGAYNDGDPATGAAPRYVVVDGATEAYDAVRWVEHLAGSFVADTGPDLTRAGLQAWFEQVQWLWAAEAPTRFATVIEEHKFHAEGSFATFLGCRLAGLDGPDPHWEAAALGDTVLFHVRSGRLLTHFPPIGVGEFGLSPNGIGTRPAALGPMLRGLELATGAVRAGDVLFIATDALAHWLLVEASRDEAPLWAALTGLDHDAAFAAIVADQRAAGRLHNDDVTLLRVRLGTTEPVALAVSL